MLHPTEIDFGVRNSARRPRAKLVGVADRPMCLTEPPATSDANTVTVTPSR